MKRIEEAERENQKFYKSKDYQNSHHSNQYGNGAQKGGQKGNEFFRKQR